MGLRDLFHEASFYLKFKRAESAIEKEGRMYDVKVTLIKGLKALAISGGTVAVTALFGFLADPVGVSKALNGSVTPTILAVLVPVITAGAHMALNYLKNRN